MQYIIHIIQHTIHSHSFSFELLLTKFTEYSFYWEAYGHSAGQEIPPPLWTRWFTALVPSLNQMNPVHTLILFFTIHFNIVLLVTPTSLLLSLPVTTKRFFRVTHLFLPYFPPSLWTSNFQRLRTILSIFHATSQINTNISDLNCVVFQPGAFFECVVFLQSSLQRKVFHN
jgi:hypothetical protein